ncbi:ATPase [Pseudoxanthomonas kalamensis DSM 18571]|uniref:SRPBCC family protein n=1 Tax=Pseudoxanthomonas kalamensis TaxID=289483 RepID=UPI0013915411|nr:SRPBCC family protein [Pseudoxanthomonas kalamensis]KAF1708810.1 ATPase [Pseudoxanthomonas kalamensis DSM 18571]
MNITSPEADYAAIVAPDTVRIQRLLPGPVERIWAYLTESDLRRQWLASGQMQPEAGTGFELVWRNHELTDPPGQRPEGFGEEHRMQSRIVEFDPPRRLVFTWGESGQVAFDLKPQGDRVLLTILHEGISDRGNMLKIGAGWHMHLDVLVARANGRKPEPYWDGWMRLRDEYDQRVPS